MEIWILAVAVVGLVAGVVWWRLRPRRVFTIDHVRIEMHDAVVVEDCVIEAVWRAAISMKNVSRRPRVLPVFAERATVRAGWREYLATVYLEDDEVEANPGEVALAWVEFVLPAESRVRRLELISLRDGRRPLSLRCRWSGMSRREPMAARRPGQSFTGESTGECPREVQQ